MFFPYRACIALHSIPVLTILVCLLCLGVYAAQSSNERALHQAASEHCEREAGRRFAMALRQVAGTDESRVCAGLMLALYHARDPKAELARLAGDERPAASHEQALLQSYASFELSAPRSLTARLWYPPESWNPLRMLTAAVAHGSWSHVIGNLFFFYAFAATIEILLGPFLYLGVLIVLALGTHIVYSLAMMGNAQALPTVGLSGVVMGMIALFVFFIPWARVKCVLWIVVFFRRFAVPAWLLATWYIGWDIYALWSRSGNPGVNLVAHVSGAALGFLVGVVFFRAKRHWAQELVEEAD
jgi:membrane associated rhomboid family serine protease